MDQDGKDFGSMENIALDLKENLKLEDRRYKLKSYPNCFIGKEAVVYIINKGKNN